jgi:hypothetical protein
VTDQGAQAISKLQGLLGDAATALDTAKATNDAAIAAKDAELAKKDAEIDALKGKVVDGDALAQLVADRAALETAAKVIAPDVKPLGLTDAALRKAVVVAKIGDAAIAGKSDAYIDARFDMMKEEAAGTITAQSAVTDALRGVQPVGDTKVVSDARAAMIAEMKNGGAISAAVQ